MAKKKTEKAAPSGSITLEPEAATIGSPVRIRTSGLAGPIRADYVGAYGLGLRQTLTLDENGEALATFQYAGEVRISSSGKPRVEVSLIIR